MILLAFILTGTFFCQTTATKLSLGRKPMTGLVISILNEPEFFSLDQNEQQKMLASVCDMVKNYMQSRSRDKKSK